MNMKHLVSSNVGRGGKDAFLFYCRCYDGGFLASEKQELQIELPVPLEPLLKEDEGYTVYQAEGENIFVDLHSEPLYLPEDRARYTQAGPQKRVQKVIERYNVQNVEIVSNT